MMWHEWFFCICVWSRVKLTLFVNIIFMFSEDFKSLSIKAREIHYVSVVVTTSPRDPLPHSTHVTRSLTSFFNQTKIISSNFHSYYGTWKQKSIKISKRNVAWLLNERKQKSHIIISLDFCSLLERTFSIAPKPFCPRSTIKHWTRMKLDSGETGMRTLINLFFVAGHNYTHILYDFN